MFVNDHEILPCPVCKQLTDSLKQYRVIQTIFALPLHHVELSSTVVRSCPPCMRAYAWRRCRINGLTTLVIGYLVLVPYTLAITLATFRRGHSWPVERDITPEMHLNRTWHYEPSFLEKALAVVTSLTCLLPGVGILISWCILWRVRWCTGWVFKTAEIASFVAYFATVTAIGLCLEQLWHNSN